MSREFKIPPNPRTFIIGLVLVALVSTTMMGRLKRRVYIEGDLRTEILELPRDFFRGVKTLSTVYRVESSGAVKVVWEGNTGGGPTESGSLGLGLSWSASKNDPVESLDWGTQITPGSSISRTFYAENIGTVPIKLSSVYGENWTPPEASKYLSVSWDYGGDNLISDHKIPLTLTLTVDKEITGITDFSFDIVIEISEVAVSVS